MGTAAVKGIVQRRKATGHGRPVSILRPDRYMRGGSAQQPGATWPDFLAYLERTEPLSLSCGSYLGVLENPHFVQGNLLPNSDDASERPSGSVPERQTTGIPISLKSYCFEASAGTTNSAARTAAESCLRIRFVAVHLAYCLS
jgi:hypothetical protein